MKISTRVLTAVEREAAFPAPKPAQLLNLIDDLLLVLLPGPLTEPVVKRLSDARIMARRLASDLTEARDERGYYHPRADVSATDLLKAGVIEAVHAWVSDRLMIEVDRTDQPAWTACPTRRARDAVEMEEVERGDLRAELVLHRAALARAFGMESESAATAMVAPLVVSSPTSTKPHAGRKRRGKPGLDRTNPKAFRRCQLVVAHAKQKPRGVSIADWLGRMMPPATKEDLHNANRVLKRAHGRDNNE
jgi:hypothetical protein